MLFDRKTFLRDRSFEQTSKLLFRVAMANPTRVNVYMYICTVCYVCIVYSISYTATLWVKVALSGAPSGVHSGDPQPIRFEIEMIGVHRLFLSSALVDDRSAFVR